MPNKRGKLVKQSSPVGPGGPPSLPRERKRTFSQSLACPERPHTPPGAWRYTSYAARRPSASRTTIAEIQEAIQRGFLKWQQKHQAHDSQQPDNTAAERAPQIRSGWDRWSTEACLGDSSNEHASHASSDDEEFLSAFSSLNTSREQLQSQGQTESEEVVRPISAMCPCSGGLTDIHFELERLRARMNKMQQKDLDRRAEGKIQKKKWLQQGIDMLTAEKNLLDVAAMEP